MSSHGVARHQQANRNRSIVDRSIGSRLPDVLRQSPLWREMQIACNGQVPRPANAFQDGQLHIAEFRHAHAEVEQAEGRVAVVWIEFGQQLGRVCVQGEQLDDRQRVTLLATRGGSAVVQQLAAVIVADEWFHGCCAQGVTINAVSVLRKRVDESKLECTSALLRQIAKTDSTESVGTRIGDCVSTEAMMSVKAAFSIDTPATNSSREDYK